MSPVCLVFSFEFGIGSEGWRILTLTVGCNGISVQFWHCFSKSVLLWRGADVQEIEEFDTVKCAILEIFTLVPEASNQHFKHLKPEAIYIYLRGQKLEKVAVLPGEFVHSAWWASRSWFSLQQLKW